MRRKIFTILFAVLITLSFAPSALGATISSSPSSVSSQTGEAVQIDFTVNPQANETIGTVKLDLDYPSSLLEFDSFSFGDEWMQLSQSGYDEVNESGGHIIKTAGYPGGLSETKEFGSVSFNVESAGSNSVVVSNQTEILDSENENIASGLPVTVNVSFSSPEQQEEQITQEQPEPQPQPEQPQPQEQEQEVVQQQQQQATPEAQQPTEREITVPVRAPGNHFLTANIVETISLGTYNGWVIALVLLILGLAAYGAVILIRRKPWRKINIEIEE